MAVSVSAVKSAVYSVQSKLLDGISSEQQLAAAGRVLTQTEYADVVTERTITDLCGYPLCRNVLPQNFPRKGRYRISLSEHKVYDLQETRHFCSTECLIPSRTFGASLDEERDQSTKTIELCDAFHHLCSRYLPEKHPFPLVGDIQASDASEKNDENQKSQNGNNVLVILEKSEVKVDDFNVSGASNAIEGYVPQREHADRKVSEGEMEIVAGNISNGDSTISTKQDKVSLSSKKNQNRGNKKKQSTESGSAVSKKDKEILNSIVNNFTSCVLVGDEKSDIIANKASSKHDEEKTTIVSPKQNGSENNFTSSIFMNDGKLIKKSGVGSKHVAVENNFISCILTNDRAMVSPKSSEKPQQEKKKKQNRVSWADHNNRKLTEEAPPLLLEENRNQRIKNKQSTVLGSIINKKDQEILKSIVKDFTSCVLVDDGKSNNLNIIANDSTSCILRNEVQPRQVLDWSDSIGKTTKDSPGNLNDSASENNFTSCIVTNESATVCTDSVVKCQKLTEEEHHLHRFESQNKKIEIVQDNKLQSANDLVSALTQAAEAVFCGESDCSAAVARAGISIVPESEIQQLSGCPQIQQELLNVPAKSSVEDADPRDCWYSAPPKEFKPEVSGFGMIWMALDEWISSASIAHVYGKDSDDEDKFSSINGKEYLRRVVIGEGVSAEIEKTAAGCVSRALPGIAETFRLPIAVSTLEQALARYLRTMTLINAIPPFSSHQWRLVVLLFLDALSVQRLPSLKAKLQNSCAQLHKVLCSVSLTEAEYEVFRDLILPMGRHPDTTAHCGG